MPKVSIIVPAYNAASCIKKTMDSILLQTFHDFECIVVDDGSTDDTVSVLSTYNDSRIKIIEQKNSGGPAKPRNVGIAAASGELICIFDSDDIMQPNKLEEYVSAFGKFEIIDVIFSDFSSIDESDNVLATSFLSDYLEFRNHASPIGDNIYAMDMKKFPVEIIKANFIGTSSVCFKKYLVENLKLFDERFSSGDDKLAWIRLAKKSQFFFFNKVFHQYRDRNDSISNINTERLLVNKIGVLDKISEECADMEIKDAVLKKKNEYYFSLGYIYRKSKRFSDAKKAYGSIKGLFNAPSVVLELTKVCIDECCNRR